MSRGGAPPLVACESGATASAMVASSAAATWLEDSISFDASSVMVINILLSMTRRDDDYRLPTVQYQ